MTRVKMDTQEIRVCDLVYSRYILGSLYGLNYHELLALLLVYKEKQPGLQCTKHPNRVMQPGLHQKACPHKLNQPGLQRLRDPNRGKQPGFNPTACLNKP